MTIKIGKAAAYKIRNAHVLLKSDASVDNWSSCQCADAFLCHPNTVFNLRQRFYENGIDAAFERKKRATKPRIVDGEVEARLIALSCSQAPEGYSQRSLRLLAKQRLN